MNFVGRPRAGLLKKDGELFAPAIDPKNHAVVSGGLGRALFRTLEREMPIDVVLWASAAGWASWAKAKVADYFGTRPEGFCGTRIPKSGNHQLRCAKVHEPDPNLIVELTIKEGKILGSQEQPRSRSATNQGQVQRCGLTLKKFACRTKCPGSNLQRPTADHATGCRERPPRRWSVSQRGIASASALADGATVCAGETEWWSRL